MQPWCRYMYRDSYLKEGFVHNSRGSTGEVAGTGTAVVCFCCVGSASCLPCVRCFALFCVALRSFCVFRSV